MRGIQGLITAKENSIIIINCVWTFMEELTYKAYLEAWENRCETGEPNHG